MTASTATAIQPALRGTQGPYERRRPEETTLYTLVQDHLDTFLAQVEQETGTGLPRSLSEISDRREAVLV